MPPATPSASSRARLLGRRELLNWLNRAAACEYADLTECGDGVAFCELLEAMHPGVVPLHRVHYAARREDARLHNLGLLHTGLQRVGVTCPTDVRKLAAAKFGDLNEFTQWFLGYVEADGSRIAALGDPAAIAERRARAKARQQSRAPQPRRGPPPSPLQRVASQLLDEPAAAWPSPDLATGRRPELSRRHRRRRPPRGVVWLAAAAPARRVAAPAPSPTAAWVPFRRGSPMVRWPTWTAGSRRIPLGRRRPPRRRRAHRRDRRRARRHAARRAAAAPAPAPASPPRRSPGTPASPRALSQAAAATASAAASAAARAEAAATSTPQQRRARRRLAEVEQLVEALEIELSERLDSLVALRAECLRCRRLAMPTTRRSSCRGAVRAAPGNRARRRHPRYSASGARGVAAGNPLGSE